MTDFTFDFGIETGAPRTTTESDRPKVDFDARREYMVSNCGTAEKAKSTIAVISGIVHLGKQKQEDAKMKWDGTPEQEADEIKKSPNQYFEDIKDYKTGAIQRHKRWPVADLDTYGIFVDIPSIMLDQGQFFGDTSGEKHPLRMLLNNENWDMGVRKMVVNKRGYTVKEKKQKSAKNDGSEAWGMSKNHTFHNLADAIGLLNTDGLFKPAQEMNRLIGKAVLVEYRVFEEENKGKKYLKEKVSLQGQIPDMMEAMAEEAKEKVKPYLFATAFKGKQNPETLKQLRHVVIETMKLASDFEGSDIQKALIECGKVRPADNAEGGQETLVAQAPAQKEAVKASPSATPQPTFDEDFDDSSLPF